MTRTGQMKTKLMDVVDSLDALERTPTAFRWTPAMSAIWPKDYRPTMTGLLAMWEAMHDAAEYSISQAASDDDRRQTEYSEYIRDVGKAINARRNRISVPEPLSGHGWIKWDGGERPVPTDTPIEAQWTDGSVVKGIYNMARPWVKPFDDEEKIIAYRVIK